MVKLDYKTLIKLDKKEAQEAINLMFKYLPEENTLYIVKPQAILSNQIFENKGYTRNSSEFDFYNIKLENKIAENNKKNCYYAHTVSNSYTEFLAKVKQQLKFIESKGIEKPSVYYFVVQRCIVYPFAPKSRIFPDEAFVIRGIVEANNETGMSFAFNPDYLEHAKTKAKPRSIWLPNAEYMFGDTQAEHDFMLKAYRKTLEVTTSPNNNSSTPPAKKS